MGALFEILRREFLHHFRLQCRSCNASPFRNEHCRPSCPNRSTCCEDCEEATR